MTKKIAKVRGKDLRRCPFGLNVTSACKCAGDSVARMASIEDDMEESLSEEDKKIKMANRVVYTRHKTDTPCVYAKSIMDKKDKVECSYGDVGQGQGRGMSFDSSPLYASNFSGHGVDGVYAYPLGFYADNNESRNLFYSLFSYTSKEIKSEIIKLASSIEDETEGKKFLGNLKVRLDFIEQNYDDGVKALEEYLEKYSAKLEESYDRHQ